MVEWLLLVVSEVIQVRIFTLSQGWLDGWMVDVDGLGIIQVNLFTFFQGWLDVWMIVVGCFRNHSSEFLLILGWFDGWMVVVGWSGRNHSNGNLFTSSQGWLYGWLVVVGGSARNHSHVNLFPSSQGWLNGCCWLKWQESLPRESLHIFSRMVR